MLVLLAPAPLHGLTVLKHRHKHDREHSMNTTLTALIVFGCLAAAVLVGRTLRNVLPQAHLSTESKDAMKLAIGLVATMSALVLGLLVSSAKGAYDTERSEVILMASKVTFLGRVLDAYGPEAAGVRALLRNTIEESIQQMWPGQMRRPTDRNPDVQAGNLAYATLQQLSPQNEMQRVLKSQATTLAGDLAQTRSLLAAQSVASVSQPMLIILVSWLVVVFVGFSVLAPPNATAVFALMISAFAVSGAIFLILELDEPFGGFIGISSEPMVNALHQLGK
jgi:hypothetical protein